MDTTTLSPAAVELKRLVRAARRGDRDAQEAMTERNGLVWSDAFVRFVTPEVAPLFPERAVNAVPGKLEA